MKNRTTYLRTTKNNNFVRTDLGITKLPIIESGIMFKILSNTNEWIFNKDIFQNNSGIGKDRFERAWNNLIKLGYITQEKISDGKSFGWNYTFTESPTGEIRPSENTMSEISDNGKTMDGKGIDSIRQGEIRPSGNTLLITSNLNNETEHPETGTETGPDIIKESKKKTGPEKTGPKKINIPDNQDENTGPKEKISTVDVSSILTEEVFNSTESFSNTKNENTPTSRNDLNYNERKRIEYEGMLLGSYYNKLTDIQQIEFFQLDYEKKLELASNGNVPPEEFSTIGN